MLSLTQFNFLCELKKKKNYKENLTYLVLLLKLGQKAQRLQIDNRSKRVTFSLPNANSINVVLLLAQPLTFLDRCPCNQVQDKQHDMDGWLDFKV